MEHNTDGWLKGLQYVITLLVIGFALRWFQRQSFKPVTADATGKSTVKASKAMFGLAYGSMVFWFALMVLAYLFPGNTPDIVVPISIFGVFLLISIALAWTCHTWVLVWDKTEVLGNNWYGKRLQMSWSSVAHVEYNQGLQVFLIKSQQGQTIWVSEYWLGLSTLLKFIETHHAHLVPNNPDELDDADDDLDNTLNEAKDEGLQGSGDRRSSF